MSSRIAHHIDFPDYSAEELLAIAHLMLGQMHYRFAPDAELAMRDYIARRMTRPNFANARSIRNALDRARLRQANRLFIGQSGPVTRDELQTIAADDIRRSRVFIETPGDGTNLTQ
jgi:hypothetical protein